MSELTIRLKALADQPSFKDLFKYKLIGLEKECLRINPDGQLANNPHPKELGSSLMNPNITTDFAESQLEIITLPQHDASKIIQELTNLHSFIYQKIGNKHLLWPNSIPGLLPNDNDILIARYGKSAKAIFKETYRTGLSYRYGKTMQLTCGIHFNFSFTPEFWQMYFPNIQNKLRYTINDVNTQYMAVIRNYIRISWLITYLFGSSPVINSKSINQSIATAHYLKPLGKDFYISPFGTSLRESDLGYHNKTNLDQLISYDSLEDYIKCLHKIMLTEDPNFAKIGKYRYNKQIQINCNILQIENEYYSVIRPKPDIDSYGQYIRPYKALQKNGLGYIEIRNLDLNYLSPIGIDERQCRLLELIVYYCCLQNSPKFTNTELAHIRSNKNKTTLLGRQVGLLLSNNGMQTTLKDWAKNILQDLKEIGLAIDSSNDNLTHYSATVDYYDTLLDNPELTPSGVLFNELSTSKDYVAYNLHKAKLYKKEFANNPLSTEKNNYYEQLVANSIINQKKLEESDAANSMTLEQYINNHYAD